VAQCVAGAAFVHLARIVAKFRPLLWPTAHAVLQGIQHSLPCSSGRSMALGGG